MKLIRKLGMLVLFFAFEAPLLLAQLSPVKHGTSAQQKFPFWKKGYMDIHHINTGEGNCTFIMMPDGTRILLDAGTVDKKGFEKNNAPLKAIDPRYTSTGSIQDMLIDYIAWATESQRGPVVLDYAIISHFHSDHYGAVMDLLPRLDVKTIIDRNYPNYDFPLDLRVKLKDDKLFQQYLQLVDSRLYTIQSLQVGRQDQIVLTNDPSAFPMVHILNIKNNAQVWNPQSNEMTELFSPKDMLDFYKGGYNENPLSMVLKFRYGKFDYYAGADNTGLHDGSVPSWFDVETSIAKAVGPVDAMVLDHHGNRDANNANLIATLDPKIVIQQVYSSDQPGQEVYYRLRNLGKRKDRLLFSTNMHDETLVTYGPWFQKGYQSFRGHVILRVFEGGQGYKVYVLDEINRAVKWESGLLATDD